MSYYWSAKCETCNAECFAEISHGKEEIRQIYAHWVEIKAVLAAIKKLQKINQGFNEYTLMDDNLREVVFFFREHEGHDMVLRSEYGDQEPSSA